MEAPNKISARNAPELFILGLVKRLSHHALWNALALFLPPLAAIVYCLSYLLLNDWISPLVSLVVGLAALGLGALAIIIRYRPKIPSVRAVARLIDDRTGAKDRFLTLATLAATKSNSSMVSRLRAEASGLQSRIAIRHEFPYRINRHVYTSLVVSLAAALLFQLLLPLAHSKLRFHPDHERLSELAQRMAMRPGLEELARSLEKLAGEFKDPKLLPEEKQRLVKEEHKKIMEQLKKTNQQQDRDLLSQAAGTLEGLEQQSGDGERKKDQKSGGGIQSNLPQKGKPQGNDGGGSGANKGDPSAELSNELDQGKLAHGDTKGQGDANNTGGDKNGADGNQRDPNRPGKDPSQERPGKLEGGKDEGLARSKVSEEIPQGGPPAERFCKPGEGECQGLKGAGYVTVQLPEALAAEGKSGGDKRDSNGKRAPRSQISVSNVPLPKHSPDAPTEKQQMPLEYRGIIR